MNYKYKYILAIDPSGSFSEGKGTTGWVLLSHNEQLLGKGFISAYDFNCPEEYWDAHIKLIKTYNKYYGKNLIIVIEDYILYKNRTQSSINSKFETCRLIGVLQHYCWRIHQDYSMQLAVAVKNRWSDELLIHEKYIYKTKRDLIHRQSKLSLKLIHTRDAYRHALHYAVCRNKIEERKKNANRKIKRSNY